jgi:hypothetical protein
MQRELRAAGLNTVGDILTETGDLITWEDLQARRVARRCKRDFEKLRNNLLIPEIEVRRKDKECTFVSRIPVVEGSRIWEYYMEAADIQNEWLQGQVLGPPKRTYAYNAGRLLKLGTNLVPAGAVQRIIVGKARNQQLYLVGTLQSEQAVVDQYVWKDGKQSFETSTSHMRKLISKQSQEDHIAIQKWRQQTTGVPSNKEIWRGVW